MVSLYQLLLNLYIAIRNRPTNLQQIQMRNVVVLLTTDVLLTEESSQLRSDQLKVLLALTVRLLTCQNTLLGLDKVHHQPLQRLVQNLP